MNPQKTHLESCGWQSVMIHQEHVMMPVLYGDDRGWATPFGVAYLATGREEGGDEPTASYFVQPPALV